MKRVLIVGAGVSGLAAAFRLQQLGADVRILEAAARPGGTTWTSQEQGFCLEHGPNGFLSSKPTTLDLARDAGLADRLVQAHEAAGRNRYLYLGKGKLQPLPTGIFSFLTSPLLSLRGKAAFLLERFRAARPGTEDESIDAFARRRAGAEVADLLADAMVTGIYAGDPAQLSLPACFPRIAALEREYGSVIKGLAHSARRKPAGKPRPRGSNLWSFDTGLRALVEALAAQLAAPPIYGAPVRRIERTSDGDWVAHGEGQDRWQAQALLLACPAYEQACLLEDLDLRLAELAGGIRYNQVAVVAMAFRREDLPRPVDGFGYIAPQRLRRDLLGVQWCSSIYPGRAPEGAFLLRAMCGGASRPELVDLQDLELVQRVRAELRLAMDITAEPIFHKIIRWPRAIPQYHLGHLDRVRDLQARAAAHPGLYLGGNAYQGVALNDCTEQGLLVAQRIMDYLAGGAASPAP